MIYDNEKIVILSLTSIAIITLVVMMFCIIFEHLQGLETIALFISVVSGVVGALSGIYVGKSKNQTTEPVTTLENIEQQPNNENYTYLETNPDKE